MKNIVARWLVVLLVASGVGVFSTGCKKKEAVLSESELAYQQLPAATNVLAALAQKNYDEAIGALLRAKEGLTTEEQQMAHTMLSREVKEKLTEAAATDPKANEALQALRFATMGR